MRGSERGFSLVELLVVLVMVAILMAVILPQLGTARSKVSAPEMNVAAGGIWRGIQNYRIDNGHLPPTTMLQNQHTLSPPGNTFADPGGTRYVKRWPSDPKGTTAQVRVVNGGGLPTTTDPSRGGQIIYSAAGARPLTGYLVAYSADGRIVFRRSIGTTVGRPIG